MLRQRLPVMHSVVHRQHADKTPLAVTPLADALDAVAENASGIPPVFLLADVGLQPLATKLQRPGMSPQRFWQVRVLVRLDFGTIESWARVRNVAGEYCPAKVSHRDQDAAETIGSRVEATVHGFATSRGRQSQRGSRRSVA